MWANRTTAKYRPKLHLSSGLAAASGTCVVPTGLRIRGRPRRVRLPDVGVVLGDKPNEPVLTTPPFLCIEILFPSDSRNRVLNRIADFLAFGVPYVWVIDTETRRAWVQTAGSEQEVLDGVLKAGHCEVPLLELFD